MDGERLAWDPRTELWRIEGGRHFTPEDHPNRVAVNQALGAVTTGRPDPCWFPAVSIEPAKPCETITEQHGRGPGAACEGQTRRSMPLDDVEQHDATP